MGEWLCKRENEGKNSIIHHYHISYFSYALVVMGVDKIVTVRGVDYNDEICV